MLVAAYRKDKDTILNRNLLLIIAIIAFSVFCSRSAVRLMYFVYPVVAIVTSFMFIRAFDHFKSKNEIERYFFMAIATSMAVLIIMSLAAYNNQCVNEARGSVSTSFYSVQWQQAMFWVRENTQSNAVFAHWWDYGYWVQSLGLRPTILDGGNSIPYWDYLMGRLVLTEDVNNYTGGMEFLKTHKANYLLIDSTDIGKYPAFSSIGSNETYDRLTSMPTFTMDESATQEKRNEMTYLYKSGFNLDEDLVWNGQRYLAGQSGIIGVLMPIAITTADNYSIGEIKQPSIILSSPGGQIAVPIKCLYINNTKMEFEGKGIEGCFYTMPMIATDRIIANGAGMWLSPRLMRSMMVNLYILNENITGFEEVHSERDVITAELNNRYNLDLPELTFHQQVGLLGPIKIWKINYPDNISENPAYLNITYPSVDLWQVK
jgi:hypothetical protein